MAEVRGASPLRGGLKFECINSGGVASGVSKISLITVSTNVLAARIPLASERIKSFSRYAAWLVVSMPRTLSCASTNLWIAVWCSVPAASNELKTCLRACSMIPNTGIILKLVK